MAKISKKSPLLMDLVKVLYQKFQLLPFFGLLGKSKKFQQIFDKIPGKRQFVAVFFANRIFVNIKVFFINQQTLNFVDKIMLFFAPIKHEKYNECQKYVKIWSTAGFEPATSGFPTTVTIDTFIMQDTNDSADSKHHGQFQEKEKIRLLNWIFSFGKMMKPLET